MPHSPEWKPETERPVLSRRDWMRLASAGITAGSMSGWLSQLAAQTATDTSRCRSVILLWMSGGPSQIDTFDVKPDHRNGGPLKPIDTSVPGMHISETMPRLSQMMQHVVPIRSMSTQEGDHSRATYHLRTGYRPQGPVHYPTLGSLLSNELGSETSPLPNFVSISPFRNFSPAAYGPGFLGPQRSPLVVGERGQAIVGDEQATYDESLKVENLNLPDNVTPLQTDRRLAMLADFDTDFRMTHPGVPAGSHESAYLQAVRMMRSKAVRAFDLHEEDAALRDAYGRNQFGQGCLLARRLVEHGVPFVEVSLNGVTNNQNFGWDTHTNNFESVKQLTSVLDPAWATLLEDLHLRGLLDSTLVVWMGEFGRTPRINGSAGRDHWAVSWTTVLCGGGVRGGQFFGETTEDGMAVKDRPVSAADLMATIFRCVGVDPMKQNMSNVGRPIRLADPEAKAITEILA
ncbi:MAG: DUF1501 domain-containing protein [Planctomycetaceae bacterium]